MKRPTRLKLKMNTPVLTLKVTERDKKLLAGFGVFLLLSLSYYFLFRPLSAQVETLKTEKLKIDTQVASVKTDVENENQILQDNTALLAQVNKKTSPFFPKVDPYADRYILLLEKVVTDSGATASRITFSDPVVGTVPQPKQDKLFSLPSYLLQDLAKKINSANPKANPQKAQTPEVSPSVATAKAPNSADKALPADAILRLPVTLEVRGSYAQIRTVITNLENLKRAVAIEGVTLNLEQGAALKANFTLSFYAVEKVDKGADPFNSWTLQGSYGKAHLFN